MFTLRTTYQHVSSKRLKKYEQKFEKQESRYYRRLLKDIARKSALIESLKEDPTISSDSEENYPLSSSEEFDLEEDKRGNFMRYGRGNIFRYGKRGAIFRYGKRGNLMRYGKRQNLFRYGKRYEEDSLYDAAEKRANLMRYGKRAEDMSEEKRANLMRYGKRFARDTKRQQKPHVPFRFGRDEDELLA